MSSMYRDRRTPPSTGRRGRCSPEVRGLCALAEYGWTETRCSQVRPTNAIRLVLADDAEMAQLIETEGLRAHKAELGTRPRVYYKNLHRWDKVFLGGSVACTDTDECAEGATVTVKQADGQVAGTARVNNYGEFILDCLEPGGTYSVTIEALGYQAFSATFTLDKSLNIGPTMLERG